MRGMALTCGSVGRGTFKVLWLVLPRRRWRGLAVHLRYLDVYAFCHHVRAEVPRLLGFDSPDRPVPALPLSIWAAAPDSPPHSDLPAERGRNDGTTESSPSHLD